MEIILWRKKNIGEGGSHGFRYTLGGNSRKPERGQAGGGKTMVKKHRERIGTLSRGNLGRRTLVASAKKEVGLGAMVIR